MSYGAVTPDYTCLTDDVTALNSSPSAHNLTDNVCSVNGSPCTGYMFHSSDVTVVTEWSLLCDTRLLQNTITSAQMAGVLVGNLLAGQIADMFGRRKPLFSFVLTHILLNIVAAFSTSWVMFAVLRFLIGFCIAAILQTLFVLNIESLPIKWRSVVPCIPAWATGVAIFALVAFLTKNWSTIHLLCAAVSTPGLLCYFFVPESIRWLATKGRLEEAHEIVTKMARMNKRQIPENTLSVLGKIRKFEEEAQSERKKYTYFDLFKSFKMAKTTLILTFFFFTVGVSWYGIYFSVWSLFGNFYLNIFLLGIVEIPVNMSTCFFNNRFGRRLTAASFMSLTSLLCLGCILVHFFTSDETEGLAITTMSLVAKMIIGASWCIVMVWTSELFPTVTRTLGIAFTNMGDSIAGMLATFVIDLSQGFTFSYSLMSILFFLSTVLCFALEETNNKGLKDSINQADRHSDTEVALTLDKVPFQSDKDDDCAYT